MNAYILTSMHAFMHTYVRTYMHSFVHTCVSAAADGEGTASVCFYIELTFVEQRLSVTGTLKGRCVIAISSSSTATRESVSQIIKKLGAKARCLRVQIWHNTAFGEVSVDDLVPLGMARHQATLVLRALFRHQ